MRKMVNITSYIMLMLGIVSVMMCEGRINLLLLSLPVLTYGFYRIEIIRYKGISQSQERILAFIGVVLFFIDKLTFTDSHIFAFSHFLLWMGLVKAFKEKEERDILSFYIISFIHIVIGASLGVEVYFPVILLVYTITGIFSLFYFSIYSSTGSLKGKPVIPSYKIKTYLIPIIILSVIAISTSLLFFIMLPRRPLGIRPIVRGEAIALSGFSDRIGLGDIAEIKENPDIVMRVKSNLPLLWRGKAFDFYTGKGWIVSSNPTVSHQKEGNLISLPAFNPYGKIARQEYYINHYNQRIIFAAYKPESIDFPFRYIREDGLETLYSPLNLTYNLNYIVMSRVPEVSPVNLRGAGKDYPEAIQARYLQLPEISGRVNDLIGGISGRYDNAYDKANAIMNYLRANYGYTLNPKGSGAEESVEDFLFNLKEGHCGYYATSMAVGLRLAGIPCRIINGFGTGKYNRVGDYYIVRQKDAHSWVEAYFPRYGWVTFDPTPPDTSGLELDRGFWARTSFYLDAMEMRWQQYVVAFSYTEQMAIYKGIKRAYLTLKEQIANLPFKWVFIGLITFIVFTAAILLSMKRVFARFIISLMRRIRIKPYYGEGFYARLLRILERKGFYKLESITPYEFACSIINCEDIVRDSIMDLTDIFYQVRFGSKSLNIEMQKRIGEGFNIVKRWRRV